MHRTEDESGDRDRSDPLGALGAVVLAGPRLEVCQALARAVETHPRAGPITPLAGFRDTVAVCRARPVAVVLLVLPGMPGDADAVREATATVGSLRTLRPRPTLGVVTGETVPPAGVLAGLLRAGVDTILCWSPPTPSVAVTPRQQQLLEHLAAGDTVPVIAAARGVTVSTVKGDLANLYHTLGVHARAQAVATGFRTHLLH